MQKNRQINWQKAALEIYRPSEQFLKGAIKSYDQHPPSLWERVYQWIQRFITGS